MNNSKYSEFKVHQKSKMQRYDISDEPERKLAIRQLHFFMIAFKNYEAGFTVLAGQNTSHTCLIS